MQMFTFLIYVYFFCERTVDELTNYTRRSPVSQGPGDGTIFNKGDNISLMSTLSHLGTHEDGEAGI